jgi:branched-chain amino acid transport system permease protein
MNPLYSSHVLDALISGLITGNTYALIAIGISLIFGVADLVNFAHGSVFALGAMLGWFFVAVLGWPLIPTLIAVVALTALTGLVIERFALRPLAGAPPIAPLLSTVAVSLILDYSMQLIFEPETRGFPSLLATSNLQIGSTRLGTLDLVILLVTTVSVGSLWAFLKYHRLGWAIRAAAQDRDAAQQMGVAVGTIQGLSFAIASGLAGIGGVLVGMYYSTVSPNVGFSAGLEGFTAATLGGLGSLPGAVVGGLILGVAESVGVTLFGGTTRQLVAFAILILVLWLKPSGLLGSAAALREPLTGTFFGGAAPIRISRPVWIAIGVFAVVLLPLFGNGYLLQVAALVAIFSILALSITLVAGTAGQVSLGQAGLFAIGAYTSALLTKDHGWSFWLALPAAGVVTAVLGVLITAPALRLRGHYVAIATLGVGAMVASVALNWESLTYGPLGIANIPAPLLFGYPIEAPRDYYLLSLAVLLVCAAIVAFLQRSHLGRGWRGVREDEVAAEAFGVPLAGYKSLAFAVGAFIAGLGGSLLAHNYTYISPDVFGIVISVLALTIVVMGGMANVFGAIVGTAVLVGLPELFRPLSDVRMLGYGVALLLLVRYRPQGLLGSR